MSLPKSDAVRPGDHLWPSVYLGRARNLAGVPYACHDGGTTAVIGSHSKALEMTSDLEVSRLARTVK